MNQLTDTAELAKQAGIGDSHGYIIANELHHLEAFRALVIEAEHKRLLALAGEHSEADDEYYGLEAWERPGEPRPSPTAGMSLAQRILHVGGRNNADGYVEFGSYQAVQALVHQVLRDLPKTYTAEQLAAARLQDQKRIAELEAKELDLYKQLAEAKLSALNGWQRYEQANSHRKELLEAQLAERKPLSEEQIRRIELTIHGYTRQQLDVKAFARAIEAAHGIKNGAA